VCATTTGLRACRNKWENTISNPRSCRARGMVNWSNVLKSLRGKVAIKIRRVGLSNKPVEQVSEILVCKAAVPLK